MRIKAFVAALGLVGTAISAHAAPILNDYVASAALQINAFEPVGQSFVAEDSRILFAFKYALMNPSYSNDPLQFQLLQGDGLGGSLLYATLFSLPNNFSGFFDVDLSSIGLTIGQTYTAKVLIPGNSPYWGIRAETERNLYALGRAYAENGYITDPTTNMDMLFRITPTSFSAVPEPSSLPLTLAALGAAVICRKKRHNSKASG